MPIAQPSSKDLAPYWHEGHVLIRPHAPKTNSKHDCPDQLHGLCFRHARHLLRLRPPFHLEDGVRRVGRRQAFLCCAIQQGHKELLGNRVDRGSSVHKGLDDPIHHSQLGDPLVAASIAGRLAPPSLRQLLQGLQPFLATATFRIRTNGSDHLRTARDLHSLRQHRLHRLHLAQP